MKCGARIQQPRVCVFALWWNSPILESASERISPDRESATLIWLPSGEWFELDRPVFRSNRRLFSFFLIDQNSETSWQWVQKALDRPLLDLDNCRYSRCLGRLRFRPVLSACFLEWLNELIESIELWASTNSSMMSPINFHRMSSVRTWPIFSSRFSFGQL